MINENFGALSASFPNRTSPKYDWCCNFQPEFIDFLNDKRLLVYVVNQFSNFSHPKILTLPLGLKRSDMHAEKLIRDSMIYSLKNVKKDKLLLSAASNWHKRPQIIKCVQEQVLEKDFEILQKVGNGKFVSKETNRNWQGPTYRERSFYYQKLSSSKFVLGLPGLGYDCYRNWEAMTMGSLIVTERGVGLDRSVI